MGGAFQATERTLDSILCDGRVHFSLLEMPPHPFLKQTTRRCHPAYLLLISCVTFNKGLEFSEPQVFVSVFFFYLKAGDDDDSTYIKEMLFTHSTRCVEFLLDARLGHMLRKTEFTVAYVPVGEKDHKMHKQAHNIITDCDTDEVETNSAAGVVTVGPALARLDGISEKGTFKPRLKKRKRHSLKVEGSRVQTR